SGGTANFSNAGGTAAAAALNFSSGTLSGSASVNVGGLLTWTGGTMTRPGITNANAGFSIPTRPPLVDRRTLNVTGPTTQAATTGVNILVQNGGIINNLAGSTWTLANGTNNGILNNGGTTNAFNNAGIFQMTGGTSNNISVIFNNTGTVNANVGTLTF